jgi:hypothetical protein
VKRQLLGTATAVALLIPGAAWAQSETLAGADLYGTGGYSTRPSGLATGEPTGYIFAGVRPQIKLRSSRVSVDLNGDAQLYYYFRTNQLDDNYSAHADIADQFSETTNGTLDLLFTDRLLNHIGNLGSDAGANGGADAALLGTRTRRKQLGSTAELTSHLNARSTLTGSLFYQGARYDAPAPLPGAIGPSNYNSYGGSLGYQLQTSEHVALGVQGHYQRANYDGGRIPDSTAAGGAATFDMKFSARWTLQGALGATLRDLLTTGQEDVFFTGNFHLCYHGERTDLCAFGDRSVGASGISGSALQGSLGASLSMRISERGTINSQVSYYRSSSPTTFVNTREYVHGSVGYEQRLNERLYFSSSAFYRKAITATSSQGRSDDYGVEAGLKYRIGVIQ